MTTLSLPQSLNLSGKSAIVTGGSRGIGPQVALELARRGCIIALVYKASRSGAENAAKAVEDVGSKAVLVQADLDSPECGKTIVDGARKALGVDKIDILVNNAGADTEPHGPESYNVKEFEHIFNVNVRAPMLLLQALLPHIARPGGRIISISSTLARLPAGNLALYGSSKAALECLSRHWALELGKEYSLTSNVVCIGIVATHHVEDMQGEVKEALLELPSAERRFGTTEDVAQAVAFLASDGAKWINGDTIGVNGGSLFK